MAKKYIDAEAFKAHLSDLRRQVNEIVPGINIISTVSVSALLDDYPAADVVEVRHGRWEDNTPTTDEYGNPLSMVVDPWKYIDLACSVCGRKATIKTNYCPNCGAKMDEVTE